MKKSKKKIQHLISGILIFCLVFVGCVLPQGNASKKKSISNTTGSVVVPQLDKVTAPPALGYPYGMPYASADAANLDLQAEYDEWKANYVTSSGANGNLRVQRDAGSDYDTVSEGMAYGMLLALYFDDQDTFDGLYRYVLDHCVDTFVNDPIKLMHWKVDAAGNNVSEFADYEIEGDRDASVPHDVPFLNLTTGAVRIIPHFSEYPGETNPDKVAARDAEIAIYTADPNYVQFADFGRDLGSAADADLDIAGALIFAYIKWGSWNQTGDICYVNEAIAQMQDIYQYDTAAGVIKAGSAWGGESGWNPCYFTASWFRIFQEFYNIFYNSFSIPNDNAFTNILDTMYDHMLMVDAVNSPGGLYPDWLSTSNGTVQKCTVSDRWYYLDESDTIANVNGVDDINGDGVITYPDDGYAMQSFNFFYDAIRVPWRMAIDYSWYGDSDAQHIASKIAAYFQGSESTIVDGYAIDGTAWKWEDRDGFNDHEGGQSDSAGSIDFTSMIGPAALSIDGNDTSAAAFYQAILNGKKPYTDDYHYYGNTLRLLSLLYLSGKMINYWDTDGYKVNIKDPDYKTVGPLTIDAAYAGNDGYAAFGKYTFEFNDRVVAFNSDGSDYSDIGSGFKTTAGDFTRIGVDATMKDLALRTNRTSICYPNIYGNALISGTITNLQNYSMNGGGLFMDNLQGDVGALDFSADAADFQYDLSNNPTYQSGESITLSPGIYGNVTLPGNNIVTLSEGEYHFYTLNVEPNTTLVFPSSGNVIVYIASDFNVKAGTKMVNVVNGNFYAGADPSRILFVVGNGTTYIKGCNWRGTLVAPNSFVNFETSNSEARNSVPMTYTTMIDGGEAFGALYAYSLIIHQQSAVFHVPLQWDAF